MSGLDGRPSAGCGSAWVHRSSSSSGWWGWRPRTRGPRGACGSGTGRGGRLGGGVRRAAPRSPPWSGPVLVVLDMVDLAVGGRLFTPRCRTPPVSGDDRPVQRCREQAPSWSGVHDLALSRLHHRQRHRGRRRDPHGRGLSLRHHRIQRLHEVRTHQPTRKPGLLVLRIDQRARTR